MNPLELETTARALVAEGKGILAADESTSTIEKRLRGAGVDPVLENRRAYREMLFTTPETGGFISGVILYDETIRQKAADGTPFVEVLKRQGIISGIKVDRGAKPLAGFPDEKITEGLDGLRERLAEYANLGARFAKWRAVIEIGPGIPSLAALEANAHALARYAALCQEAGLVPIVEPEVLMDGNHRMERTEEVTGEALRTVFSALISQRVRLEGMLLKPNMVVPGKACSEKPGAPEIAGATLRCLRRFVPAAVPGIVFLSGGLSEVRATELLNEMNRIEGAPWELSFSFGRALQESALKTWAGKSGNVSAAQKILHLRAKNNSAARAGKYAATMEPAA
jgi:fructose-bisphosphate aldolase, class I